MTELTIILPVYNEIKEYVIASIDSILQQTFSDFYLYITLDKPTNIELQVLLEEYADKDSRISFYTNEENMGLPKTLNRMLTRVKTKYVARMDADDIAKPDRLQRQYDFMLNNPNVDLCGTNIIYIDKEGNEIFKKASLPESERLIRKSLSYLDVLVHPSFFAKSSVMEKMGYRDLKYAQDYDLVCRLAEAGYHLANINEYLLYYRIGLNAERKLLEQWLTAKVIRIYYNKRKLCSIDIVPMVSVAISHISNDDIKRYSHSNKIHEEGVLHWKNGNRLKGMIYILKSLFLSKMQKDNFIRALKYKLLTNLFGRIFG